MTDFEIGYLAGLFDGEGCVAATKNEGRYRVRLIISQKDLTITNWVQSKTGLGKATSGAHANGQPYTSWRACSIEDVLAFAKLIVDHCILKKRQLELAIEWAELGKFPGAMPHNVRTRRQEIGQEICLITAGRRGKLVKEVGG